MTTAVREINKDSVVEKKMPLKNIICKLIK